MVLTYQYVLSALISDPKDGSGWQPFDPKYGTSFTVFATPVPITGTFTW